ncbi:restriction endonuclease subunit S [Salmonella enterica]|uniref:restriction endonuclease subunit S n=1 Tax=Enterobacteriaceae TaxID=543 RepID=UPI000C15C4DE|nr:MULTISPECIES: restriction endonuclease subunit S [Enterobacteriaceae]EGT4256208.1 restriction endonuclease subunit S [Citrobacter amalonaticus]EJX1954755.1 restriction endonuclease subunit S [Salmonella enterica]EJX3556701.1 restriction endonuclease subunit S [Salmonella enterica]MDM2830806.1 restriction endonuclease subunit S [Citrobacter sp. Cpo085]MEB0992521.1 restriction endonuclease subunit S [Citrobacter freundii]
MSGLNFLNKLLDGVDVEWLSLGELGDFIRGNGLQKKDFVESGFPAIHYGQIYTRYGLSADKTFTYVLPELANKLRKAQKNDLLLATTSENDEDVVKPLAWLGDNVAISGDMMLFRHEQNVKYLAYFFQSEIFQTQKMKYITGAKVRRVSSGDLSKIKIPIPCSNNPEKSLTIQSEIVRILDRFTALTAELTAELTMRKNQYNYYRDQLLCFDEAEVEWKTLADVAILRRGRVMSKGYLEQNAGDYPVYSSQTARNGMIGSIDTYDFDGEFISWTTDGANAGTVFYRTGKFSITNVCGLIKIHENYPISYKYLYYWLSIEAQKHVYSGMGNPKLMSHQVEKITVPIPFPASPEKSMLEQQRIVGILDKLEAITFSLTEGLPREIELRQKQYEYYRDLLFSFPRPETASN